MLPPPPETETRLQQLLRTLTPEPELGGFGPDESTSFKRKTDGNSVKTAGDRGRAVHPSGVPS